MSPCDALFYSIISLNVKETLHYYYYYHNTGDHVVCVSTLEGCGPILLTNCISKSVVDKRETGGVVQERWNNLDNNKELVELLKMYPDTLSLDNILIYCALHSASEWNKV